MAIMIANRNIICKILFDLFIKKRDCSLMLDQFTIPGMVKAKLTDLSDKSLILSGQKFSNGVIIRILQPGDHVPH